MDTLKGDLHNKSLRNLYILHGEEKYLLEYYLGEMKKLIDFPDFNIIGFDATTLNSSALTDAVETVPTFSERKLVIITDCDIYGMKGDMKECIEALLDDIPHFATLVFHYDTQNFKPDARTKIHKLVKQHGFVVPFELRGERELIAWLSRRFRAHNKLLPPAEAERMLFICGRSMTLLVGEVEKVAAYSQSETISASDIETVCVPIVEAVVFELTDSVAAGRHATAVETLRDLGKAEPVSINSILGGQLRRLLLARIAIDTRKGDTWLAKQLDLHNPYAVKKTLELARRVSTKWCAEAVRLCADCALLLKTANYDRESLMEELLLRLAALKR